MSSNAVAHGELLRKKEAMELLVSDIKKGGEENEFGSSAVNAALRVAIERGWIGSFTETLRDAKKQKESEIDRICSRHYGE